MLQALMEYGARLDSEPGFKTREVRWRIDLDQNGQLLGVIPLGDGKRGQMLARCPDMHGMTAVGEARKSHFLIESAKAAVLLFKQNEEQHEVASVQLRHNYFVSMLDRASGELPQLAGLAAAVRSEAARNAIRDALAERKAKPTDWIAWRVGEFDPRTDAAVQEWWRRHRLEIEGRSAMDKHPEIGKRAGFGKMMCLLTGQAIVPLTSHSAIGGLQNVGGDSNSKLVSFDKSAFASYGFKKSTNAAMSAAAAQQYADGLNDLIRNHSRKLANALVVHWFKEQISQDDDPLAWLDGLESDEQTAAAAQSKARALLDAIRQGQRSDLGDNRYYAMTLSGASGRVMVRDWMEGSFEELVRNVEAWFNDLQIVARGGEGLARDPKFMAVAGGLVRELKDLPAPTAATLWKSAVARLPIPRPLMAQALARFRADLVDKDQPAFNHARMGLIKAYFVRLTPEGDSTVTAYLNTDHPEPAYHCGRLLAVLAELQFAALGDVGAGVVQRYYASTSQSPGLILGRLVRNAQNHLSKPDKPWLRSKFELPLMEIVSQLKDEFPRILDLEGQGLFALGYYQQLADMRAEARAKSKKTDTQTTTEGEV